jgi:hypothetical protein
VETNEESTEPPDKLTNAGVMKILGRAAHSVRKKFRSV